MPFFWPQIAQIITYFASKRSKQESLVNVLTPPICARDMALKPLRKLSWELEVVLDTSRLHRDTTIDVFI
jgi:hypothetical protein